MKKYIYELMTDKRQKPLDKIVQCLLWLLSLVYGVIAKITYALYHDHIFSVYRAPVPVVSVGNITTGGVGKTPFVIWLARMLDQKGKKVVVLTRGFGAISGLNDET